MKIMKYVIKIIADKPYKYEHNHDDIDYKDKWYDIEEPMDELNIPSAVHGPDDCGLTPSNRKNEYKNEYLHSFVCSHSDFCDSYLKSFVRIAPNLHTLILDNCVFLTDNSMEVVGECCTQLSTLSLEYCLYITHKGVQCVTDNNKQL